MDDKNKEKEEKTVEYNTPIPITNFNGTPNLNIATDKSNNKSNGPVRVRRPLQHNSYMMHLTKNGYIGLQILIIILTLAAILGIIIGSTIYVYTK